MRVSDNIPKIYVLGPSGAGKSTFIGKHFSKEVTIFENLVVESSEMVIPETFSKIYLILPEREKLAVRNSVPQDSIEETYWRWMDFYAKNKSKIVDIVWVKEF